MDLGELYKTQISLTEWFERAGHPRAAELRQEDNEKRERLRVLNRAVGLPFDEPYPFRAQELARGSDALRAFLSEHGNRTWALRLIPLDPALPKLRLRGKTGHELMEWFAQQEIDPDRYRAEFVPHAESQTWSTIFVVNPSGIYGEIVQDVHAVLTQGFHENRRPIAFASDFEAWTLSEPQAEALEHVRSLLAWLRVEDPALRERLSRELDADFAGPYLCGYFETTTSQEAGTWFVDYNRILGEAYREFRLPPPAEGPSEAVLRGQTGSPGKAAGRIRIVMPEQVGQVEWSDGDILVCPMTSPEYLPLMLRASAVVTDQGGILSHAAITCRELGKPCLTAARTATQELRDGDLVEVDADAGAIRRLPLSS